MAMFVKKWKEFLRLCADIKEKRRAIRRIDNKKLGGGSEEEARSEYLRRLNITLPMEQEYNNLLRRRRVLWRKLSGRGGK